MNAHEQSKGSSACSSLLFVDLDGFKAVNDVLGHAAGDALLAIVGARLAHALRQGDFVSRHGGDEFVCLLSQVDDDERALALARKLMDVISTPCQIGRDVVKIRASIGVALFPRDGGSVAALLERADQAMRWAKSQHIGTGLASPMPDADSDCAPMPRPVCAKAPPPPRMAAAPAFRLCRGCTTWPGTRPAPALRSSC